MDKNVKQSGSRGLSGTEHVIILHYYGIWESSLVSQREAYGIVRVLVAKSMSQIAHFHVERTRGVGKVKEFPENDGEFLASRTISIRCLLSWFKFLSPKNLEIPNGRKVCKYTKCVLVLFVWNRPWCGRVVFRCLAFSLSGGDLKSWKGNFVEKS